MVLAAIDLYEVLVAGVAIAAIVTLSVTVVDRQAKRVRVARDEAEAENRKLRARVVELEARPDMTRLAEALERHEHRAAERHARSINVLEKIAEAWDIRFKNGGQR